MSEPVKVEPAKVKKVEGTPTRVVLRDISKGIFFFPLAIYSFIAAIIEHLLEDAQSGGAAPSESANILALIWVVLFFANVFVVSFDFSTGKFLILILVVVVIGLVLFLLMENGTIAPMGVEIIFNLQIRTQFYVMVGIMLAVIVVLTLVAGLFRYVRIEANEVLVKGILGDVKRFPTANLHYDKKISDVFEYMTLRAGSIILHITGAAEPVELYTVIGVNKKARQMDTLLSAMKVTH